MVLALFPPPNHLNGEMESGVKESRCPTTFYSFPLFIQSRAMLMSCTTMDLKAKTRGKKEKFSCINMATSEK